MLYPGVHQRMRRVTLFCRVVYIRAVVTRFRPALIHKIITSFNSPGCAAVPSNHDCGVDGFTALYALPRRQLEVTFLELPTSWNAGYVLVTVDIGKPARLSDHLFTAAAELMHVLNMPLVQHIAFRSL
jgi:hypothetical protein